MSKLISQLNSNSSEFKTNEANMNALVNELNARINQVYQGGDEKARARHLRHGKLLPRERLQQLLDPGSPFLEFFNNHNFIGKACK